MFEPATAAASPVVPNVVEVARQKAAVPPPPPPTRTSSLWSRFLLDDEHIKLGGLISKRKGLFSKKRQLLLTSKPRLIYIDPIRMKQKGEIPWSTSLYVQSKSNTAFDVVTVRPYCIGPCCSVCDHVNLTPVCLSFLAAQPCLPLDGCHQRVEKVDRRSQRGHGTLRVLSSPLFASHDGIDLCVRVDDRPAAQPTQQPLRHAVEKWRIILVRCGYHRRPL
jgi:hypothetical protein